MVIFNLNFCGDLSELKFNDNEVEEVKWMSKEEITKALQEKPEKWTTTAERFREVAAVLENILTSRDA